MPRTIKTFIILACTLLAFLTQAEDINLLKVRNTDNGDLFNLVLSVDDQKRALGLKLYDLGKKSWKTYNLSDLPKGVALRVERGHEVLTLRSRDFENDRGGHFKLGYLVSAISGSRKSLPLKFDFDGSAWKVFYKGSPVKRLDFMVKKFFGRNIGIQAVKAY